ncbi:hypothetical protein [Microcoleus sp. PH2017_09_SFU_O_A]|uniref:hypothetical protein n=1 Tax=Microcoleus sp. PH2017_09_SFU_O_A TaxID=2798820 RepID=UPI001D63BC03|nr:hypothetical protein [Microcoleus sp. PH2017_09_SFU_O_A]MCC3509010.1 hypothetical protein [Microcoleus sp. PH2017_17_BER_D_A]
MAKNRGSRNLCPDAIAQQKKPNPQRLHKKLSQQVIPYLPPMTKKFTDGTRHVIYPWNQSQI